MTHNAYLYDSDKIYASKLGSFMNISDSFPFTVYVCSTKQELKDYMEKDKSGLVIISETSMKNDEVFEGKEVIFLSNNKSGELDNKKYVNKYQSGEKIIKDILNIVSNSEIFKSIVSRKNSMKIISFFTPIKRSLSTTMCLAMGQLLGKRTKTLYISFECFSGLKAMLNCEFTKNIGDLLCFMDAKNDGLGAALAGIVEKKEGLDILAPFDNQMDLINVESYTWISLIERIEKETDYEYVLLDLSDAVQGLFDILKMSNKIITSVDNDEVAIFKLTEYEECLKHTGYEAVLEKTKKCNVPHQHRRNGEINFLGFGELGDYVKSILQGVIDDESKG